MAVLSDRKTYDRDTTLCSSGFIKSHSTRPAHTLVTHNALVPNYPILLRTQSQWDAPLSFHVLAHTTWWMCVKGLFFFQALLLYLAFSVVKT